jgi:3-oxoacyl-ACP reductase-like protein
MDNKLLHLRLGPDEIETLDEMCMSTFSRQQIASMILTAAISAVRENNCRMSFPPKFTVGIHEGKMALDEQARRRR